MACSVSFGPRAHLIVNIKYMVNNKDDKVQHTNFTLKLDGMTDYPLILILNVNSYSS